MTFPDAIRLAPGDRIDDFEIIEVLAEGGTSTTFRAASTTLQREVVLKYFRPASFTEESASVEAARRDASAVARLEHPGIAAVYAAGQHAGGLYVASALPSGDTLADRGTAGVITPDEAARSVSELADALAHAHRAGVLHRDLRPECVSVSRWGNAMLRDFGVTRTSGRTGLMTRAEVLGSLRYTAPEIILGRPATPASDVYALASVAVWALTGAPPYHDRPASEYVMFKTSAQPPTLADATGQPIAGLSAVVARGMALDPAERPTPAAFAAALAAEVAALPASVRAQGVPFIALEDGASPAPAASDAVPSSAGQDRTRVEHRRPLPAPEVVEQTPVSWTTYAACVTVALIVGLAAIGIGRVTAPKPQAAVRVGPFAVNPPDGWSVVSRGDRLELQRLGGGSAVLAVASGRLPGDPVPAAELGGGSPAPKPQAASSAQVPLVVYRTGDALAIARPTTAGALWASCRGISDAACTGLVANARTRGKPVPATPDQGVASALRETLATVQQETGVALSEMEGDRKQRAAAAERLSTSLRESAGALKVDGADPGTAAALEPVQRALAKQAAALDDFGDALDRKSEAAENAARRAGLATQAQLKAALAKFARAGYPVEG